jgi:O-antigen ligase
VLVAGLWCVMGPLFVVNEVLKRRDGHTRWYLEAPAGVCMFLAGVVAFVSMLPSSDVSANVPRYLMAGWFLCAAVGIASWVRVVFRLRAARRSSASPSSPPRS